MSDDGDIEFDESDDSDHGPMSWKLAIFIGIGLFLTFGPLVAIYFGDGWSQKLVAMFLVLIVCVLIAVLGWYGTQPDKDDH